MELVRQALRLRDICGYAIQPEILRVCPHNLRRGDGAVHTREVKVK